MQRPWLLPQVAFKKTFSYAGFEQQPKKIVDAKICILNVELELKSEKDNAEVRYPARCGIPRGTVSHAGRYPARHGELGEDHRGVIAAMSST
jgi:hypothetical protein